MIYPFKTLHRVGIRTCSDYSPFGVELDGRTVSGGYRYGYQGSEKDNETKGNGNSYTTEFRQLDPRLGRWLSVDPFAQNAPDITPYRYGFNSPISFNDQNGLFEKKKDAKKYNRRHHLKDPCRLQAGWGCHRRSLGETSRAPRRSSLRCPLDR